MKQGPSSLLHYFTRPSQDHQCLVPSPARHAFVRLSRLSPSLLMFKSHLVWTTSPLHVDKCQEPLFPLFFSWYGISKAPPISFLPGVKSPRHFRNTHRLIPNLQPNSCLPSTQDQRLGSSQLFGSTPVHPSHPPTEFPSYRRETRKNEDLPTCLSAQYNEAMKLRGRRG